MKVSGILSSSQQQQQKKDMQHGHWADTLGYSERLCVCVCRDK